MDRRLSRSTFPRCLASCHRCRANHRSLSATARYADGPWPARPVRLVGMRQYASATRYRLLCLASLWAGGIIGDAQQFARLDRLIVTLRVDHVQTQAGPLRQAV